ncbi:SIR2 family protein [Paludisphaera rhizosphaerae]|uniref:SIR2 family protein n=1 Tax=Paludisphaera rhizosphaerae TaxID=2711216 RepID=UPI0013ECA6AF|nr:SIR2 family protein [Paludisphaera rhizosphaerae]
MGKKKPKLELPTHLLNEIEAGNVVLMLGAGASREATNEKGEHPPLAGELAERIAKQFLTSKYYKSPLNLVSAYAISQSDIYTFQKFVAETVVGFKPGPSHHRLKAFRWSGIATTNYDTLLEDAYDDENKPAAQKLVTAIDDSDRPDDQLKTVNSVLCLKLHGCVTRVANTAVPLILTTEQYNTHEKGRKLIFDRLFNWAATRPVLYAGYSLQDANLLGLIQRIHAAIPSPPRSFLVTLGIDEIQKTHWEHFRISAFNGTFEDLADTLDTQISGLFRGLRQTSEIGNLAISDRFIKRDVTLPFATTQFLERDADYVKSVVPAAKIEPKQFYMGTSSEWSAVEQELDVRRHLTDSILLEHILPGSASSKSASCFIVVKSHAGSGKSVFLQRLAWDASREYDKLCLKIRPGGNINLAALSNLADQVNERIFLFVDNIVEYRRDIVSLFDERGTLAGRITVVGAARTNEWNLAPDSLTTLATNVYDLKYLSRDEIDGLLAKLETHKSLGTLEKLPHSARQAAFLELADRQLLVALHEATLGKPFEDIILDEYNQISPHRAQLMYLTVCLLYQFGSPVRAGLISRLYNLPFSEFEKSFFKPLEQIISATKDTGSGDMVYKARHPHIAELVVSTVLQNKEDLFHEVLKAIRFLNPSYNSDNAAFRRLLNGTTLVTTFPDHQMVSQLFEAAEEVTGENAHLLQQKCIYEMKRQNGNLSLADSYIQKALSSPRPSNALHHTHAELHVRRAEAATQPLDKRYHLEEAIKICEQLKSRRDDPFPYYTLLKIKTVQIRDELNSDDANDESVDHLVRAAEKTLREGMSRHSDNAFLLKAEADLATVLSEHSRAIGAMERSFEINNRASHIAVRLAAHYESLQNLDKAVDIFRKGIAAKASDQRLHYLYAKLLSDHGLGQPEEISHYLKKSFGPGDRKLEPRLLYGRQLFLMGKLEESDEVFHDLRNHRMSPESRTRLRFKTSESFIGQVIYMDSHYFIISRSGDSARIYCSRDDLSRAEWDSVAKDCRVRFNIGFCMNGVRAFAVQRA